MVYISTRALKIMIFHYILVLFAIANANVHDADFAGRIINGLPATNVDDFAFRVFSIEDGETLLAHVSTGVAISESIGLVVAQAVYNFQFWYIGYDSIHVAEHKIQRIDRNNIKIHPDYYPDTLRNNIAVIKFTTPVSNFLPIALGPPSFPILLTFGYGFTDADNTVLSNTLQHLLVIEEPQSVCEGIYPGFVENESTCSTFSAPSAFTYGNQGGPIIDSSRQYLHGITSYWGQGNEPLVGINVPYYKDFIQKSIDDLSSSSEVK